MPRALLRHSYWLACGLALLLSMPARFGGLKESLWLDEAWVANSLLAPTLHQTLYFDRWAQSTPPLFLAIARAALPLTGYSEAALRIVPFLAAILSPLLLAAVLRRLFSAPIAFLGFAMVVSNYWAIKYGQEVKQYGTDLLIASLLLLMVERMLRGERRADYVTLGLLGGISCFLSFPSVFWFASCVVAVLLPGTGAAGLDGGGLRYRRAIVLTLVLGACLGVNYVVFIRPNLTSSQFRNFATEFVDPVRPGASLLGLQQVFATLLIPLSSPIAKWAALLIEAVIFSGAIRSLYLSLRGDRTALTVLLVGPLPIAAAIVVSASRLYPLLSFPRFVIWTLPCCAALFCYALVPAAQVLRRMVTSRASGRTRLHVAVAAGLGTVMLSQFAIFAFPRPSEKNRDAVEFIRSRAHGSDLVFVHGGMNEQFLYYRRLLSWYPAQVYFGNTDWPCCALDHAARTSSPAVQDFLVDVDLAAAQAGSHTLWLLLPRGSAGHWSSFLAARIEAIPNALSQRGCQPELQQPFSQTLVLAIACKDAPR